MTFDSSNRKEIESLTTGNLIDRIRRSMGEGCIHPSHVFDMVDEALQRLNTYAKTAEDIHDRVGVSIRNTEPKTYLHDCGTCEFYNFGRYDVTCWIECAKGNRVCMDLSCKDYKKKNN